MAGESRKEHAALSTVLAHLYRGEVARADNWRTRLDNSTNWALTTSAAVLSFGLGSADASHGVILVGMFLVLNFLFIESRRYRVWDVYLRRVRILESYLYAPLLRGDEAEPRQLRELALMLDRPKIMLSFPIALAQRVRRAYGPVLVVLVLSWLFKVAIRRDPDPSLGFIGRMHIGFVPGWVILTVVSSVAIGLGALTFWSLSKTPPATEMSIVRRHRRSLREALVPSKRTAVQARG